MLKLFLDANTAISGLFFDGNEAKLLELGKLGLCNLIISEYVLKEIVRVLRSARFGLSEEEISFLISYLFSCAKLYKDSPPKYIKAHYHELKDEKDVPVLAGFLFLKCDYLITGDKELLKKVERATAAKKIIKLIL